MMMMMMMMMMIMLMMMMTNDELMFHAGNYEYGVDNGDDHEEEDS